ncbi:MAG TPA: hypothetical protein VIA29_03125, partial [Thermoanaerobaculia bacterium]
GLFPPASDGDRSEPLLERPRFECLEPRAWPTRASSGLDELLYLLQPRYIESLPLRDAWGNRLLYATSNDLRSYAIVSMGRDGGLECCYRRSVTRSDDMVYSDGSFRAFPGCGCG